MIKANELRVGNWVRHVNDNGTFEFALDEVLAKGVNINYNGGIWFIKYEDLIPVPISEDWLNIHLIKEGEEGRFPTSFNPFKKCYSWNIDENLIINQHPDDGFSLCIKYFDGYDFDTRELRKINFAHEVQNIYLDVREKNCFPFSSPPPVYSRSKSNFLYP